MEATTRLTRLADRLRARAETGPPLTPDESRDASQELTTTRETIAALAAKALLFRQDT